MCNCHDVFTVIEAAVKRRVYPDNANMHCFPSSSQNSSLLYSLAFLKAFGGFEDKDSGNLQVTMFWMYICTYIRCLQIIPEHTQCTPVATSHSFFSANPFWNSTNFNLLCHLNLRLSEQFRNFLREKAYTFPRLKFSWLAEIFVSAYHMALL